MYTLQKKQCHKGNVKLAKSNLTFQSFGNLSLRINKNTFVISISKYPHPPQRAYIKSNSNKLSFIDKKNELKNTQNFNELFHDAGQFYIGNKKLWLSKNIHSNSRGFLLPRTKSVDLDTKEDLNLLKFLFSKKKK